MGRHADPVWEARISDLPGFRAGGIRYWDDPLDAIERELLDGRIRRSDTKQEALAWLTEMHEQGPLSGGLRKPPRDYSRARDRGLPDYSASARTTEMDIGKSRILDESRPPPRSPSSGIVFGVLLAPHEDRIASGDDPERKARHLGRGDRKPSPARIRAGPRATSTRFRSPEFAMPASGRAR